MYALSLRVTAFTLHYVRRTQSLYNCQLPSTSPLGFVSFRFVTFAGLRPLLSPLKGKMSAALTKGPRPLIFALPEMGRFNVNGGVRGVNWAGTCLTFDVDCLWQSRGALMPRRAIIVKFDVNIVSVPWFLDICSVNFHAADLHIRIQNPRSARSETTKSCAYCTADLVVLQRPASSNFPDI